MVSDESSCIHNEHITLLSHQETSNTINKGKLRSNVFSQSSGKNECRFGVVLAATRVAAWDDDAVAYGRSLDDDVVACCLLPLVRWWRCCRLDDDDVACGRLLMSRLNGIDGSLFESSRLTLTLLSSHDLPSPNKTGVAPLQVFLYVFR